MTIGVAPEDEASWEEDVERAEFADWKGASSRTLQEIWDNEADAVHDLPSEATDNTYS